MHISHRNEFEATPEEIVTMFGDEDFLREVTLLAEPSEYEIATHGDHATVTRVLPLPEKIRKFVGASLTMVQDIRWRTGENGHPAADIEITVPHQPVRIHGTAVMTPAQGRTVVDFDGDIDVTMPFIGKVMEKEIAPYIEAEFGAQQRIGTQWLTSRSR